MKREDSEENMDITWTRRSSSKNRNSLTTKIEPNDNQWTQPAENKNTYLTMDSSKSWILLGATKISELNSKEKRRAKTKMDVTNQRLT